MEVEVQEGLDLAGSSGPQGCGWVDCRVVWVWRIRVIIGFDIILGYACSYGERYADRILIK